MKTRPWFVLAVLCVLAFSLPARAENTWTPIGPDGGSVTAVVVHPTDPRLVWAGTNGGGVFKSTNGGRAWSPAREGLGSPFVNALVADPGDPDTLYAEVGYPPLATEIYKTTDGGATWQPAGNGLPPARCCGFAQWIGWLAIDPVRPNILYTGTANGIYKTVNGGASWFRSTRGVGNRFTSALAVDPSSPDTLYVGARRSIWKSVNGGATWTNSGNGMSGQVRAFAIDPRRTSIVYAATDAGLFKSTNAGASWQRLDLGQIFVDVRAIVIDPGAASTLYAGTRAGAFKSLDGGTTWQGLGQAPGPVGVLALSPSAPHILFGGSGIDFFADAVPGVFKSSDAGAHWAIYRRGMAASVVVKLAASPANPAVLYAGTAGQGVFRSDDGGVRWQVVNAGLSSLYVYALAVDPRDPLTAYVSVANNLFKTTDGGATWVPHNQGLANPNGGTDTVLSLAIHPQDSSILLAGGDGRVFKSTDGGASWRVVESRFNSALINIEFAPSSPSTVYAATVAPIVTPPIFPAFLKSTDGGETWSLTSPPDLQGFEALAVDPHNASTLYAAGGGRLYASTDGAATWTSFSGADTWIASLAFSSEGILYAGTYMGVFEISEGGACWTPLSQGLVNGEVLELTATPGVLYAGTRGGGVYRMD
ncbi:MAG TPA: hypothetical protein VMW27_00215 [Thermoanaerobaculia bacterium]|nr:hypothetical protein [Thermoanaerobaculia bacterium]